jgi:uncharacterized membrane protein YbhN (UPF0104 family)
VSRTTATALRLGASLALLALAWRLAEGERLLALLAGLDPVWLVAAVALSVPMHVLSAARWRYTCLRLGLTLGGLRALGDYYLASLVNMTLPGGVGGDLARAFRHGHARRNETDSPYRRALHAVLLERAAGQGALLLLLAAGALAQLERFPWLGPWAGAGVATVAALLLAVVPLARRLPGDGAAGRLVADAGRAFLPAHVAARQALLSLAVVATYVAAFWCASRAVHAPLPPGLVLLAVPLVLTAMTLPVSVGGLGVREASAAALWPLLGLDGSAGAASALCYGAAMLLGSLPGALVLLWRPPTTAHAA